MLTNKEKSIYFQSCRRLQCFINYDNINIASTGTILV